MNVELAGSVGKLRLAPGQAFYGKRNEGQSNHSSGGVDQGDTQATPEPGLHLGSSGDPSCGTACPAPAAGDGHPSHPQ